MNNYVRSIVILAILSGILKALLSNYKIKKYVNYLIGLIMVIMIIMPFNNFTHKINVAKEQINGIYESLDFQNKINDSNSVIVNTTKEKVTKGLKDALISKYGFDERDIFIELILDDSEISSIKITGVNIILTNKASWSNVDSVKSYTENLIGVNVNVTRK